MGVSTCPELGPDVMTLDVHNLLSLDDRELRVPGHDAVVVVRGIPEHEVANLVGLPRVHERDVARNGRLEDKPPAIEVAPFLLVAGDQDASAHTAGLVTNGDTAMLDFRVRTGRRVDGRLAGGMRVQTRDKRALGHELDTDVAVQVCGLEVLVSVSGTPSDARQKYNRAVTAYPPRYEIITFSS